MLWLRLVTINTNLDIVKLFLGELLKKNFFTLLITLLFVEHCGSEKD